LPQIFIKNGGASNLNADGVHPNDAGHVLMANALLSCI
jgi:lysophospholipase L1-like esterase